jgi:hypothetical protein
LAVSFGVSVKAALANPKQTAIAKVNATKLILSFLFMTSSA